VQTEVLMSIFMMGNVTGVTETLNNKHINCASKFRSVVVLRLNLREGVLTEAINNETQET
jgi:hypothetical protein